MTDDIEKSNFNPQMLKSCTDTAYECGYRQGATDMEKAKQIIIDSLLKQIEQIRADAYKRFAEVIALDIADCSRCPIDCDVATYGDCEKALIAYVKEQNS